MALKDLTGNRYGSLVVTGDSGTRVKNRIVWSCQCDCGGSWSGIGQKLTCGGRTSCDECRIKQRNRGRLEGRRFGMLEVIDLVRGENSKRYWLCRCDCGNEIEVITSKLTTGEKQSCGCKHNQSLVGRKYGMITFVERVSSVGSRTKYRCLCDCGTEIEMESVDIGKNRKLHCGCQTLDANKRKALRRNMKQQMAGASLRGLEWSLTEDEFETLTSSPCFYCGDDPHRKIHQYYDLLVTGIDRIDSSIGYVLSNCVPCCKTCNMMKVALGQNEFIQQCIKIASNRE